MFLEVNDEADEKVEDAGDVKPSISRNPNVMSLKSKRELQRDKEYIKKQEKQKKERLRKLQEGGIEVKQISIKIEFFQKTLRKRAQL